jgi:hypothetical protein
VYICSRRRRNYRHCLIDGINLANASTDHPVTLAHYIWSYCGWGYQDYAFIVAYILVYRHQNSGEVFCLNFWSRNNGLCKFVRNVMSQKAVTLIAWSLLYCVNWNEVKAKHSRAELNNDMVILLSQAMKMIRRHSLYLSLKGIVWVAWHNAFMWLHESCLSTAKDVTNGLL